MISYRLLASSDFFTLYNCFLAAFSDYQVDMRMSQEHFAQRIVRDGVRLEISVGAFDDEKMIGFYMNGSGNWLGKQTAYDAGTGVIPEYRGRGIAQELFEFVVPRLKEAGLTQYLLEVLSSNNRAVALYQKLGFVLTRRLAVFRPTRHVRRFDDVPGLSICAVEKADRQRFESFWDSHPSWQNSMDAVERIADEVKILCAYVADECVGYGIVFRPAANLMQLAVAPGYRRRGIGCRILANFETQELKVNNIDEKQKATLAFYEANGFKQVLQQYEMIKNL
jgi:ribosomal protein S18 acetylase RimI-like enzyme